MLRDNRLTPYQIRKIIRFFCVDVDATKTALLLGFNRKTVNRYFFLFRQVIALKQRHDFTEFVGVVELDESYFGPTRQKEQPGKRERGTFKKPVFGIFERQGRVYTELVSDCTKATLQKIVQGRVDVSAVVNTDGWRGYDGLVDVGYDQHFRVNHAEAFCRHGVPINGIESFWSFTKRRLAKFNGVKANFYFHLKECEWRWGRTPEVLEAELWGLLKRYKSMV